MKWWFVRRPEALDLATAHLLRKCETLEQMETAVQNGDFGLEPNYLGQKNWGRLRENVGQMVTNHLCRGVFRSKSLREVGLTPESAYADLRSGLNCVDCGGGKFVQGTACPWCFGTGEAHEACRECRANGSLEVSVCPKCMSRSTPRRNCSECKGAGFIRLPCDVCTGKGRIRAPYPIRFMKRLQFYWVVYVTERIDELRQIFWGTPVKLGVMLLGATLYTFFLAARSYDTPAHAVTLDDGVKVIYAACALKAVYASITVTLAFLLMFEGTSTLELLRPLRDASIGDPTWADTARIGVLAGTSSFIVYSFGVSLLSVNAFMAAQRIDFVTLTAILVALAFSLLLTILTLGKVRSLISTAKTSRLEELEYLLDNEAQPKQRNELLAEYEIVSRVETSPIGNQLRTEIGAGFILPLAIQILAIGLQLRLAAPQVRNSEQHGGAPAENATNLVAPNTSTDRSKTVSPNEKALTEEKGTPSRKVPTKNKANRKR